MRAAVAAFLLAGVVAADDEVTVDVRERPPIVGTLLGSAPLKVETRYGTLSIPAADLLSIDPREGLALARAGAVRGRFDWTDLAVRTGYGDARVRLEDAVRVTWKRQRTATKARHHCVLADGTSVGGTVAAEGFEFATAYGALRIPLSEVRFLAREEGGYVLSLPGMTLKGSPKVERWCVETDYGPLRVPAADLLRLSPPIPAEGDRLEGGYVVRAVDGRGASVYALVSRDQMTWMDAAEMARSLGGHLAAVGDEEENELLRSMTARVTNNQAWIGFSDEGHEGDWRWVTDEPARYTKWNGGEPNNAGGRENHCEFIVGLGGRWNDVDGRAARAFCLVEIGP